MQSERKKEKIRCVGCDDTIPKGTNRREKENKWEKNSMNHIRLYREMRWWRYFNSKSKIKHPSSNNSPLNTIRLWVLEKTELPSLWNRTENITHFALSFFHSFFLSLRRCILATDIEREGSSWAKSPITYYYSSRFDRGRWWWSWWSHGEICIYSFHNLLSSRG